MSRLVCTLTGESHAVDVFEDDDGRGFFTADGDIDADGANGQASGKAAYHPRDIGLDFLANAGYPRFPDSYKNILVLDHQGKPVVQASCDPAPGFFISKTAYRIPNQPYSSPLAYLDAETVPFIVVSPKVQMGFKGVVLACRARVTNLRNGKHVDCVVGDIGPLRKIGELSIAAAKAIGINPSPKFGGTDELILKYEFWPSVAGVIGEALATLQRANGTYVV